MPIGQGYDCLTPVYLKKQVFNKFPEWSREHELEDFRMLRFPCGHCLNCRFKKSRENALRLQMEAQYCKDIAFVTLTYDPKFVPVNFVDSELFQDFPNRFKPYGFDSEAQFNAVLTLDRKEIQNFFKRLRKKLDYKIRFYCCGEYGTQRQRPHYHAIIFGLKEEDFSKVNEAWGKGFTLTKPTDDKSFYYVTGYVNKKLGKLKDLNPFRPPEFMNCSQGLGLQWVLDRQAQFDDEHLCINFKGFSHPLPRYFTHKLQELGVISKMSFPEIWEKQQKELNDLYKALEEKHTTPELYFRARYNGALIKSRRVTSFRDQNKEF